MAVITMENRAQTSKPPRVTRQTTGNRDSVRIQWGASQVTLSPVEAQKLADALNTVL
jgi:hypothetical protein